MTNAAPPGQPRPTVASGQATERAMNVLAANAGPMTLDGTNTWIISEPDATEAVVIDPGPLDEEHLGNVIATAERAGKRIVLTLLTHGHGDHSDGVARFAELTGAPVRAQNPIHRVGEEGLESGDVIRTGGLRLEVVRTPGHTRDSVSFLLPADNVLLSGDTILGRGTTVVAHPDGHLGDYLDSLRALRDLVLQENVRTVLPGHGPVLDDAQGAIEYYLVHRANRLAQVETAVENGYRTPEEVVAHVYAEVDRGLWPAAEMSVRAQLDYLTEHGLI